MKHIKTPFTKCIERPSFSKLILFFTFCLLLSFHTHAQEIWGTTYGGSLGVGTIFKVDGSDGSQLIIPFKGAGNNNPEYFEGQPYHYRMLKASNGKLYGMTLAGGQDGEGILFEFDQTTGTLTTRANFGFYNNPGRALGNLVEYEGKLYATSNTLSSVIFSYNLETHEIKTETLIPSSCRGLTLVNGKFYGMTRKGGTKWAGAIFEFDPHTSVYKVLYQFDHDLTGRFPLGGLTHVNGKLYGLTTSGGQYSQGTLIEYDIATNHFEKKIDFKNNINGTTPLGELIYYNGKLLGSTSSGGIYNQGVLFEYDPASGLLSKLIDFNSPSQGRFFDNINGTLYGVTNNGGGTGRGTLFTFDRATKVYNHFFEFNTNGNGSNPFGHVLIDDNKVWGMTQREGPADGGVLYEYDLTTHQYAMRYAFNHFPNGFKPICLTEHNSKFYGVTIGGGEHNSGVLFEFDPETLDLTTLHNFSCSQCHGISSDNPVGKIVVIGNTLYGITWKQSNIDNGELFSFNLTTNTYARLYEFTDYEEGIGPHGNLTELNGKLYVTTRHGGTNEMGMLFEYDTHTATMLPKFSLNYLTSGTDPGLVKNGNELYAVGRGGPNGSGLLTSYDPVANVFIPKHVYAAPNGANLPSGALVSKSSKVYGTTWPVTYNVTIPIPGTVFSFDTQTQQYETEFNFSYDEISTRMLALSEDKLYGTAYHERTLFEFDLNDKTLTLLPSLELGPYYDEGISSLLVRNQIVCSPHVQLTEVIEYTPGKRKDGLSMDADRTDPQKALYDADAHDSPNGGVKFISLGFGGVVTLAFDQPLCDGDGNDFRVYETSYSNPSFYDCPEQAEVFVSQDGSTWISLGVTSPDNPAVGCNTKLDTDFNIQSSGLAWIKYVKVVDVTKPNAKRRNKTTCAEYGGPAFNNASDGFDLDAIEALSTEPLLMARKSGNNVSREVNIDGAHSHAMLHPNPVSDKLVIDLSNEEEMVIMENEMVLEVMDVTGRILHHSTDAMDEHWAITYDAAKLHAGMYIARVKSGGVRRHYKFLKK